MKGAYLFALPCISLAVYLCMEDAMRTTLDIPEELISEAMELTRIQTKTDLIKTALQNLIQKERIKDLKNYFGKVNLEIDLDTIRKRR